MRESREKGRRKDSGVFFYFKLGKMVALAERTTLLCCSSLVFF